MISSSKILLLLVVTTLSFLLLSLWSSSTSSVSASFSVSNLFETSKDKVKVVFIAGFEDEEDKKDFYSDRSRIVPISLSNGTKYECHIPERITSDESDNLWRQHLKKLHNRPLPQHLYKKVNSALSELCFTYPDGWWSYKLCWRKHMRQFHADTSGKVEAEFFIGKGPLMGVEDGAVDELLYDIDPTNPTRARLVSEWFNGTVCDLTGKEREMVVYFVCPAGAGGSDAATTPGGGASTRKHTSVHSNGNMNHAIQADLEIVETGICMYQATLKHQAFCEVPELRSRSKPETIVRCTQDQNQRSEEEQRQYVEIGDFSSTSGDDVQEQQKNSEEQEAESEQAFEVSN